MTTKGTLLIGAFLVSLVLLGHYLTRGPGYEVYERGCCYIASADGCLNNVHKLACDEFGGELEAGQCNPHTRRCE